MDDAYIDFLFPAYAGVIPGDLVHIDTEETFPRLRGGDPLSCL